MTPNAIELTDAQDIESDGPLFYTLPQSVQDDLAAHFLAMDSDAAPAYGAELLAA